MGGCKTVANSRLLYAVDKPVNKQSGAWLEEEFETLDLSDPRRDREPLGILDAWMWVSDPLGNRQCISCNRSTAKLRRYAFVMPFGSLMKYPG